MQALDLYFRLAGVTLLLFQFVLIIRDSWDVRPARFGALLIVGLIEVVSDFSRDVTVPLLLRYGLSALAMNTAIFIWWFSRSLFDDDFRLGRIEWTVALIWLLLGIPNFVDFVHQEALSAPWAAYARSIMAVAIVSHIVYQALAGRKTDLVERRRRIRILFSFAIAGLFLVDLWSEFVFGFHAEPLWFSTIEDGAVFAVILWGALWLIRFDKSALTFDRLATPTSPSRQTLSPKEQLLHKKLIEIIEAEKAYLEPELSITALAARIGAPEHQVRTLINKAMCYRNFRAFLNSYRMKAAKSALADPQKADLPILTIAMDSGFASLSSFNRAFKEAERQTPSAYRQAQLGASASQN